jgi:hypothetical protein
MKGVRISRKEVPAWLEVAPLKFQQEPTKEIEHVKLPDSNILKLQDRKRRYLEKKNQKIKAMHELIDRLPVQGEDFHIIGGGNIDAFHIIPCTLRYAAEISRMYIATWSMTRDNMKDLLKLFDAGKIGELNIVISIFFQGRYKGDCAFLKAEMKRRNQKIVICKNHAKVILMDTKSGCYVFQGSANFTANPRAEQMVFSNSGELFHFHKQWMDSLLGVVYP